MAELTPRERLQPSLLDRLTDDEPSSQDEAREKRVICAYRLRDSVRRDLAWLLNCVNMGASLDAEAWPEVARSVLNFGIPDLTGAALSGLGLEALQRQIRAAILAFEPRLEGSSLRVTVHAGTQCTDRQALAFDIQAQMWAQPLPMSLYLKTEIDLGTGKLLASRAQA